MAKNFTFGAPRVLQPHFLQRRLLHWIDDAYSSESPLIILRGTSGTGKSALLATWLQHTQHNVAKSVWCYPGSNVRIRTRFWQSIMRNAIAAGAVDESSQLAQILLKDTPASADVDAFDEFKEQVLLGLNSLEEPLLIIIDDFESVSVEADRRISEDFFWLAERTRNIRCIILTERSENAEYREPLEKFGVPALTERELFFTEDEVVEFYDQVLGNDAEAAQLIFEATEGNPRATATIIRELSRIAKPARTLEKIRQLVHQLLDNRFEGLLHAVHQQPALGILRDFAVAESLDEDLLTRIAEQAEYGVALNFAEENGIGFWQTETHPPLFSLLGSLRERLVQDLEAENPTRLLSVRKTYTQWLLDNQKLDLALQQIILTRDWKKFSDILVRNLSEVRIYHLTQAAQVLSLVPGKELRKYPFLLYFSALMSNANSGIDFKQVVNLANLGLVYIRDIEDTADLPTRIWIEIAKSSTRLFMGNSQKGLDHANTSWELVQELRLSGTELAPAKVWADPTSLLIQIFVSLGELDKSEALSNEILQAANYHSEEIPSYALFPAVSNLAFLHALRGETQEVEELLVRSEHIHSPHNWQYDWTAWGLAYAEAQLAIDSLDSDSAATALARMDEHYETISSWPFLLSQKIKLELLKDNAQLAAINLRKEQIARKKRSRQSPLPKTYIESFSACLFLATNRPEDANESLSHLTPETDIPDAIVTQSLNFLINNQPELAAARAQDALWHNKATLRNTALAFLLSAVAEFRLNNFDTALKHLDDGLKIIIESKLSFLLVFIPQFDLRALIALSGIHSEQLLDKIPDYFSPASSDFELSKRELAILHELDSSLTLNEIAALHYVSRNTIKSQLRSIYRKLGVNSRNDAVAKAHGLNILESDPSLQN